ncbi:MAG: LssY C-terminal domain-containing protein [Acidobacteriota bacterium]|nr:LssY C-terminal domain-containing protein [Acidobacteriota bacterium]
MSALIYALSILSSLAPVEAPAGTQIHVRLTSTVGSYASRVGSPVEGVLIAPVQVNGVTVLPARSKVFGEVESVRRVGFGVIHESAAIGLQFDRVVLPDGADVPISTRVQQVDNGRERVNRKGLIERVRSTGSVSHRVCGYIKTALLWQFHADVAYWAIKTLIVQVPEPEIYFQPGVELTLVATAPLRVSASPQSAGELDSLSPAQLEEVDGLVAAMPARTVSALTAVQSDLINLAVIGSREQLAAAFAQAGWVEAHPVSFRSKVRGAKAVAEGMGYRSAPMSAQLLDRSEADMSLEKGLNDVSKRHHVRVWKQPGQWRGQDVWVGAGTRDLDFAYLRPGGRFTHTIEENIDQEREKIVYDLAFTSCVEGADWIQRKDFPKAARNATGDPISTDGRLALVRLNDCTGRQSAKENSELTFVPQHGTGVQRFVRREILSMRNDLFRANPYFRSYEGIRALIHVCRRSWPQLDARNTTPVQAGSSPRSAN